MKSGIENGKFTENQMRDIQGYLAMVAECKWECHRAGEKFNPAYFDEVPVMELLDYLENDANLKSDWADVGHTALAKGLEDLGYTLAMRSRICMDGVRVSFKILTLLMGN